MLSKFWKKSLVANGAFNRICAINIAFNPYIEFISSNS